MTTRRKKQKKEATLTNEMPMDGLDQPKPALQSMPRIRTPRNDLSVTRKDEINLKAWFVNLLSTDRRIKEHHYEQVRLYMHGLGLGNKEEVSKYENALKGYFGG